MGGKTTHDAQCFKSCKWTKVIDLILEIELFEQQCVIIKGLLKSYRIEQHMVTIGIDKLLSKCEIYKHGCLEDTKKLYTSSGKWDDKMQFKAILEA